MRRAIWRSPSTAGPVGTGFYRRAQIAARDDADQRSHAGRDVRCALARGASISNSAPASISPHSPGNTTSATPRATSSTPGCKPSACRLATSSAHAGLFVVPWAWLDDERHRGVLAAGRRGGRLYCDPDGDFRENLAHWQVAARSTTTQFSIARSAMDDFELRLDDSDPATSSRWRRRRVRQVAST